MPAPADRQGPAVVAPGRLSGPHPRRFHVCTAGQSWSGEQGFFPARDDHTFLHEASLPCDAGLTALHANRMKKASVILHGLDRSGEASADLFDHEDSCSERDGCAERAP
jgi:hypothetical protein